MPKFRTTATRLAAVLAFGAAMLGVTAVAGSPAGAADITRVELRNRSTGLRADVMWASTAVGTGVFLWPDNTSTSQEFNLLDSGGGSFRIQARHSGQCLIPEWRNGPYANGTRIVQHPDCSATYGPGQWHYAYRSTTRCNGDVCSSNSAEPVKLIVNNYTGRCLDTANGTTAKPPVQAALQLWDCIRSTDDWNVKNQSWTVAPPGSILIDG